MIFELEEKYNKSQWRNKILAQVTSQLVKNYDSILIKKCQALFGLMVKMEKTGMVLDGKGCNCLKVLKGNKKGMELARLRSTMYLSIPLFFFPSELGGN